MNALLTPRQAPRLQRRAMRLHDVDAVVAIEQRAYGHPWSRGNFVDSLVAGYLAEVLEDEAGLVRAYLLALVGVDELHLLNVTVAPELQGLGLGRLLLQALEARGRELGLATLWLEVRESNQRARDLYQRLGYSEVGRRRGYYPALPGREDAIVMSQPLRAVETDDVD